MFAMGATCRQISRRAKPARGALSLSLLLPAAVVTALCAVNTSTAAESNSPFTDADREYWIWQPVARPEVPATSDGDRNPIDAFIRDRWQADGILPAPEADRRTLIRRATFDLHGLPPTPEEVAKFVADDYPQAYEKLIDRLLASPRYGEHWARYWLDLVRYAESDGFKSDDIRPSAWRYRDYVIGALNEDKPYDRFIVEQLAGDELPDADLATRTATGFLLLGPYEENGRDVADQRQNILNDVTDVTGQVFLGLTIGCARCHDHKFDPVLQRDYFRLQAFFAGLALDGDRPLASREAEVRYADELAAWQSATAATRQAIDELEAPYRAKILAEKRAVFPDYMKAILDVPADRRSPLEVQMAALAERQLFVTAEELSKQMSGDERKAAERLQKELAGSGIARPAPLPHGMVARDIGSQAPDTAIPGEPQQPIEPGILSILDSSPTPITSITEQSTGRRTALAHWIASPQNPLTARVAVNRIWQQHFGLGIVATSGDFGLQGEQPTHPELLDWLTSEFIAGGFRQKSLHRLIMTSAAYRRGSATSAEAAANDSDNYFLARFNRRRLSAEQLRDAMLTASGELNLQMGGESVRGELPEGISVAYAWKPDPDPRQRSRRSVYMFARRNLRDPLLDVFDLPDTHETCTLRLETITAPQALQLMNGPWALDRARAFAGRVLTSAGNDEGRVVPSAYQFAFGRDPVADELAMAERFLADSTDAAAERLARGEAVLEVPGHRTIVPETAIEEGARVAAVVDFCHVLLNSNEFLYID